MCVLQEIGIGRIHLEHCHRPFNFCRNGTKKADCEPNGEGYTIAGRLLLGKGE